MTEDSYKCYCDCWPCCCEQDRAIAELEIQVLEWKKKECAARLLAENRQIICNQLVDQLEKDKAEVAELKAERRKLRGAVSDAGWREEYERNR